MEQNSRQKQIEIQLRIQGRDRHSDSHHLSRMLDQAAAPGMMITASRRGPSKPVSPLSEECFAQRSKTRVYDLFHRREEKYPVLALFRPQLGRTLHQFRSFL